MKPFTTVASVLFALVAATYACRIFEQWNITIAGIAIPLWASYLGLLIPGGLSRMLWLEARHTPHG